MRSPATLTITDLMTPTPATVSPGAVEADVRELLEDGEIQHIPVVDGSDAAGLWIRAGEDALTLRGASSVGAAGPHDPPARAFDQLFDDKEAVLVWDDAELVGILTHSDVRRLVDQAVADGIGARPPQRPVVVRFLGPRGAGKSTLIMRTLPLLWRCEMGLITSHDPPEDFDRKMVEGCPAAFNQSIADPEELDETVADLGDVQVVTLDDRPADGMAAAAVGEDLRVLVVPVAELNTLNSEALGGADALIITKLDLDPAFDTSGFRASLLDEYPYLTVIGVAAALGDRGMHAWRRWLHRAYLPRLHWQ